MTDSILNSTINSNKSQIDPKEKLNINIFWIGFVMYSFIYTYAVTGLIHYKLIVVFQLIQFVCIAMILGSAMALIKYKFDTKYLSTIFTLYFMWGIIVLLRGFSFDVEYIKISLLDAWFGAFIYLSPLIILFPKNDHSYKALFNSIIVLGIIFTLFFLLNLNVLLDSWGNNRVSQELTEYFTRNLSIPTGFILLTYVYHNSKKVFFALGVLLVTFLLAAIRARRGIMFAAMCLLFTSYLVFYFSSRGDILKVIFSVLVVIALLMYGAFIFTMQKNGAFGLLSSRMNEDTRSRVIENYKSDMSVVDWIVGRGSSGYYYCPGIDEGFRVTVNRDVIENGFYQIILKEGLIGLILFGLMAIPAMIKGFFKSKNILSKAAAVWILLYIINLYASVGNGFVLYYLLVWVSIGICFSPTMTSKTNEELKQEFL